MPAEAGQEVSTGAAGAVGTPAEAPARSVRVVLVDDDALVRAALRLILEGHP